MISMKQPARVEARQVTLLRRDGTMLMRLHPIPQRPSASNCRRHRPGMSGSLKAAAHTLRRVLLAAIQALSPFIRCRTIPSSLTF